MNRRNFIKTLVMAVVGAVWGKGLSWDHVGTKSEGRKVMTFEREMVAGTPVMPIEWGTGTIYTGVDFDNETCAVQVERLVGYKRRYFDPRNWTQDMRDDCLMPPLSLDDLL